MKTVKYGLVKIKYENPQFSITYKVRVKEEFLNYYRLEYLSVLKYTGFSSYHLLPNIYEMELKYGLVKKEEVSDVFEKQYNTFQMFLMNLGFID